MKKVFILIFGLLLLSSCASIINSSSQEIFFTYNTNNVKLKIKDINNNTVFENVNNQSVIELDRNRGYFKKQTYTIEAQKKGFLPQTYILRPKISNWYLFGNLGFGGIWGWFLIDPLTGGMYRLTPNTVNVNLVPIYK